VRVTDLLTKVSTAEEVLQYCGAFLQLYREEAHYLERTAHWLERVGIAYVRARVVDDEANRAALHERFLFAQSFVQDDPWGIAARKAERFADLASVS
jgi:nitrite reductase (NADH) large subunit